MQIYCQSKGIWTLPDLSTIRGYSGHNEGRNNPELQGVADVGPCPRGLYMIGDPHTSLRCGPYVMALTPVGHNALGRTNLLIHGDSVEHDASHGCIIIPGKPNRFLIWNTGDRHVEVVE